MTAPIVVMISGAVAFVAGLVMLVKSDDMPKATFVAMFGGIAVMIAGLAWADVRGDLDCPEGQIKVASGPPIYVKSGDVLVPIQSTDCVVQP